MAAGDHIKVRRAGGLYTHHGIDMGDGTVVHFSGEPLRMKDAVVCRIEMADFLQGGQARVVDHGGAALPAEAVMKNAGAMLGMRDYHPIFNNCEHFASYCKTGLRESRQVRRAAKAAAAVAVTALVMGAQLAAAGAAKRAHTGKDRKKNA